MFTALQQIEGHIVAPTVFSQALRINPLLVIFALLMGGRLYGIAGAFLALPLAAVVRESVVYFREHLVLEPWGTPSAAELGHGPAPPTGPEPARRCPECGTAGGGGGRLLQRLRDRARRRRRGGGRRVGRALVDSLDRMAASRTDAPEALRAEALSKAYGARRALQDVSFSAAPGELLAIIGPNGAGKTTLLQILAGALAPTTGSVSLDRRDVGWVPQQPAIYSKLSVRENLRLFARLEKVADVAGTVDRMLEQAGLSDRAGDAVGTLSGGNQQRVNIAVGLLGDPAVLLLDEPSSSLDPRQRERLWEFVAALARDGGTTVVYSTHNVAEAERYADRLLVLADGELLFSGTPAELERATGEHEAIDFEGAFVRFLRDRGH